MFLVDSHCHLNMLDSPEVDQYIVRAQEKGVGFFLNVSVSIKEFPKLLQTAESYPYVATTIGLHPNEQEEDVDVSELVALSNHSKVIGIGETGLDYFRSTGDLTWQRERFRRHIQTAKEVHKPLIIHTRDAEEDTIRMMTEENAKEAGGVMHCFTGDWEMAQKAIDLGFYISFSGIVTFKNAQIIQDVAKRMPLERMLIETDSPYLAPIPHRGKPNEPSFVRHTAEYIAELRGLSFDDFSTQTTENFFTLFKGAVRPHV